MKLTGLESKFILTTLGLEKATKIEQSLKLVELVEKWEEHGDRDMSSFAKELLEETKK